VIARGRAHPRIEVGSSGAIVTSVVGTATTPPRYAARSACDWSEAVTLLPWGGLDFNRRGNAATE
jgi:hypothetical protein